MVPVGSFAWLNIYIYVYPDQQKSRFFRWMHTLIYQEKNFMQIWNNLQHWKENTHFQGSSSELKVKN